MTQNDDQTRLTQVQTPPADDWQELPRGAVVGRYIIISLIGAGGMGMVYAAYDPDLDRKLAIKLIRPDRLEPSMEASLDAQLLREARILASLSHPNILPVFDVGRFGEQLFLATEFIDGQTLAAWQKTQAPSWQETLSLYLKAGQGLAAAHAAGIVHRDFKPQNVLLSKDKQIRVMDFGLSQRTSAASAEFPSSGSLSGTLAYMAPEQLKQQEVTPLSDQFSFAVSMCEALYGQRPFQGETPGELLDSMHNGPGKTLPDSNVPRRLRRILARALSTDPGERYPDMPQLLAALRHDPARRQRQWLLGGALAAAFTLAGLWIHDQQPAPLCQDAEARFQDTWNPRKKQELARAFARSSSPYASQAILMVNGLLDKYRDEWTRTYTQACRATHISGNQSQQLLDIRMLCLDSRRQEAAALIDILGQADANLVSQSVKAAGNLSPISSCSNIRSLAALHPPPDDEHARSKISRINHLLAQARASLRTGQYSAAREQSGLAVPLAQELGYRPLIAQAEFELASSLKHLGIKDDAEKNYRQSYITAIAASNDTLAARSATGLVWVLGHLKNQWSQARNWARYAESFLTRTGGNTLVRAQLYSNIGTLEQDQGHYEAALERAKQVLALRKAALGPRHERVAVAMVNLANAHFHLNGPEKSIPFYRQAYRMYSDAVGDQHPVNILILSNLASALSESGQLREAEQVINKALELAEKTYGKDHYETALTLQTLANIKMLNGDHQGSLEDFLSSYAIVKQQLGADHPFVLDELAGIITNLVALEEYDQAKSYLEEGYELIQDKQGQEFTRSVFLLAEARIVFKQDHAREKARKLARHALQEAEAAGPRAQSHKALVEDFLHSL